MKSSKSESSPRRPPILAHTSVDGRRGHISRCGSANNFYGKHHTDEAKAAMRAGHIGKNTGPRSPMVIKKIADAQRGKPKHSSESRAKISAAVRGRVVSIETRRKMADAHRGSKSNFWRGGARKTAYKHYQNVEYRNWRSLVFKRDDFTCQLCAVRGVFLHPHHIKSYTFFPELRYEVSNGVTLCVPCHKKHHKNGGGALPSHA